MITEKEAKLHLEILRQIHSLHVFNPNNQVFGDKLRQVIIDANVMKEPVRDCEIDNEDCLNCGA